MWFKKKKKKRKRLEDEMAAFSTCSSVTPEQGDWSVAVMMLFDVNQLKHPSPPGTIIKHEASAASTRSMTRSITRLSQRLTDSFFFLLDLKRKKVNRFFLEAFAGCFIHQLHVFISFSGHGLDLMFVLFIEAL